MKKWILILLVGLFALSSCNLPNQLAPTDAPTSDVQSYTNEAFGLSFRYPETWFGPDEYAVDNTLRVAVGSDVVTPYGGVPLETKPTEENSYQVILQYVAQNQNPYLADTLASLEGLQDGEMEETGRSRLIRVRSLNVEAYSGYEYIATLSESAQTEYFYARQVVLQDADGNLLTMMGVPNFVNVPEDADWRDVYESIDRENLATFNLILDSLDLP